MRSILVVAALSILFVGCGTSFEQGPIGVPGPTGAVGGQGETGQQGSAGSSCTVSEVDGGVLISCPDGTSAVVHHGENHCHH